MEFHGMETSVVEVLRAPELQRLRRVRQLGLAHLVFPGAEHSRLAHSIGASYLAIRFARHLREATRDFLVPLLRPNESAIRDFAIAALVHDLGHGPMSHLWEREVIGENFDRKARCRTLELEYEDAFASLKWHELVGQAILAHKDGPLHRLLEQQESGTTERVRYLLLDKYYLPYLPRLLASDIDVDRCDFILRDAIQSGVAYGKYDLEWLIATLNVGVSNGQLVAGFDRRKSPAVIDQFLNARRSLYETVYYHKTVRAAEGMLGLLLKRVKEYVSANPWPLEEGGTVLTPFKEAIQGKPLTVMQVQSLDDYSLWLLIQELSNHGSKDPTFSDLAKRILARDLYKQVPCSAQKLQQFLSQPNAHEKIQKAVSPYIPGDVKFYYFVDNSSFKMFSKADEERAFFVDVDSDDRIAVPIRDNADVFAHRDTDRDTARLFCVREAVDSVRKLIS